MRCITNDLVFVVFFRSGSVAARMCLSAGFGKFDDALSKAIPMT